MQSMLKQLRTKYFTAIANLVPKADIQIVILTHFLEDRPELIEAISAIAPISLLIAIPYSIHQSTLVELEKIYPVATPTLEQLYDKTYLITILTKHLKKAKPFIILEIGGYFAPVLQEIKKHLSMNLLGVVEDTEAGHRRYEKISHTVISPIISVARSELKNSEDFLVGTSCLYSTEKLFRKNGFPIEGKPSLVLGFGKIGRGIAHALSKNYCPVAVDDTNPVRCISALSEGFQIPNRNQALKKAEIIYGATGTCSIKAEDFKLLRDGALLVSCSSKDIEFDLAYLKKNYYLKPINETLDCYENAHQQIYLAAKGTPINFVDGAVIGPVLALVQAEIIIAIKQLLELNGRPGLFETDHETKKMLAEKWLDFFRDEQSGHYCLTDKNHSKNFLQDSEHQRETMGVK